LSGKSPSDTTQTNSAGIVIEYRDSRKGDFVICSLEHYGAGGAGPLDAPFLTREKNTFSIFEIWEILLASVLPLAEHAFENLYRQMTTHAQLTWFDIDIHKSCQLTCDHCFYNDNYPRSRAPALAPKLLEEAIQQAMLAQVRVLTFSGMEPTLAKNFGLAICSARRARAQYASCTKVGLITNGLMLPQHFPLLEQEPPDFIDVSLDGWEYQNIIRSNSRDRVLANLKSAKEKLHTTRVGTSTVLRNDNIRDVIAMIEHLADWNEYFYFEPVVAAVDKAVPSLNSENLVLFVTLLRGLAEKRRERASRFSILLNGDQALPLLYRGLIEPEQIEEDDLHSLYIRQEIGKAQIDFILRIVPEYYWRAARLSYDGYWLGTCDLLQAPDFREVASGNFAETPDVQRLFRESLERGGMFHQFLQGLSRHSCGHTPREQQYCLNCFSTRMVSMMHHRYGSNANAVQHMAQQNEE
jgi:MoaA/NifB/PqqE/SkfB family radical SAM enzyme